MTRPIVEFFRKIITQHRFVAVLFGWLYTGFGQFYNQQFLKGILFLLLNLFSNQLGNLNEAIMYVFNGDIEASRDVLDYQNV